PPQNHSQHIINSSRKPPIINSTQPSLLTSFTQPTQVGLSIPMQINPVSNEQTLLMPHNIIVQQPQPQVNIQQPIIKQSQPQQVIISTQPIQQQLQTINITTTTNDNNLQPLVTPQQINIQTQNLIENPPILLSNQINTNNNQIIQSQLQNNNSNNE